MQMRGEAIHTLVRKCCGVTLAAVCTSSLCANDVVTVRTPAGSVVSRTGTVVEFTASELRFQAAGGREQTIPAEQIVRIETARTPQHDAAERSFAAGNYQVAAGQFAEAIRGEERAWVRREMLARLVLCYRGVGDGESAGRVFLQLAAGGATTNQFATIPLAWQAVDATVVSERQARSWLDAPGDSAANLIGASHLVTTTQAADAMATLERLTTDRDARIALLAETQRWRTNRAGIAPAELVRRGATVERLPSPLRGGPYFVLGETLVASGKVDEGVAMLMRVPIEHPGDRTLAAASLSAAGAALESAGRAEEARLVRRELERDFADVSRATKENGPHVLRPSDATPRTNAND